MTFDEAITKFGPKATSLGYEPGTKLFEIYCGGDALGELAFAAGLSGGAIDDVCLRFGCACFGRDVSAVFEEFVEVLEVLPEPVAK